MISFEDADEFLLISQRYDTQDVGLVVVTIKRLEKILRIHFVKNTVPSKSTFGQLVKFCDLDGGIKASLFLLADIRNDFVHKIGCYSFSSDRERTTFINKANKFIRHCAKRVNKPVVVIRPDFEKVIEFESASYSDDKFRDFNELLESFPELQEKVDRDEDDLYNDILYAGKMEYKFLKILSWGSFGIAFAIAIVVVVQQVFGRVGGL